MEIVEKINILVDTIVVGDVEQNKAQGSVDVIGGKCKPGYVYDPKKKVCVPINESSVVGGSYVDGTTSNIIGSAQTRTGYTYKNRIINLARKEPIEDEYDDETMSNILGRKSLKFNKDSGAYIPDFWLEDK